MPVSPIHAICPLDGRYVKKTGDLAVVLGREAVCSLDQELWPVVEPCSSHSSEFALMQGRIKAQIAYLEVLWTTDLSGWKLEDVEKARKVLPLDEEAAQMIKNIEFRGVSGINNGLPTKHDVKAVEFYLRYKLEQLGVGHRELESIHLGLTSEDPDNIAVTSMLRGVIKECLIPSARKRWVARDEIETLEKLVWTAKFGGAVGNRNAQRELFPSVDSELLARLMMNKFDLQLSPMTTQIEPNDTIANVFQILLGINQEIQEEAQSGSLCFVADLATISDALSIEFIRKQPLSRRQRDLSGSTIRRNYGTAVAFTTAALYFLKEKQQLLGCSEEKVIEEAMVATDHTRNNLDLVLERLCDLAMVHKDTPLLARTHGQAAVGTTFGKEMGNFAYRLYEQITRYLLPAQKEQNLKKIHRTLARISTVLIGFCQDMWQYISDEYVLQKPKEGEIGSSTMPQKINPIDFENAEGNCYLAAGVHNAFATFQEYSRAAHENRGMAFAYLSIACLSLLDGLTKISINQEKMNNDLVDRWEVIAEPLQQMMRKEGISGGYEAAAALTKGKRSVTPEDIRRFVIGLSVPDRTREAMLRLTPLSYLGDANQLTMRYMREIQTYLKLRKK